VLVYRSGERAEMMDIFVVLELALKELALEAGEQKFLK
jgi:hypothetical protein